MDKQIEAIKRMLRNDIKTYTEKLEKGNLEKYVENHLRKRADFAKEYLAEIEAMEQAR